MAKLNIVYQYKNNQDKPVPMLAYYQNPNKNAFDDDYLNVFNDQFIENEKVKHIWNMNAYIIYNEHENEIISYKFNDSNYFLWLLRIINLPLEITFKENFINENDDFFANVKDELIRKSN